MLEEQEEIIVDCVEEVERSQLETILKVSKEIFEVQQRLNQKGFISCTECGDIIPEERRIAYPPARTCTPCQTHLEKTFATR